MSLVSSGGAQIACGDPAAPPGGETSSTGEDPGATTEVPTTGAASTTGGNTAATGATENSTAFDTAGEAVFIVEPDGGPFACDAFAQDCPECEKCAPYGKDSDLDWNATQCVPVTGEGQPGETCTTEISSNSGLDDCEEGAMCWWLDAELRGRCVALCIGSADVPVCADATTSCISGENALHLCLPNCDPLVQDCPGDDLCLPIDDDFRCVLDGSGDAGAALDPCKFANTCDPGLVCAGSTVAIECDPIVTGCCTPMCGLDDADFVCPGVGQACVSLYEEGMAPPKYANVGYCTVPK